MFQCRLSTDSRWRGGCDSTNTAAAIVLLTFHEDVDYWRAARALGVLGYVIKRRMATDLPIAVREALAGRPFASPPLGSELDAINEP